MAILGGASGVTTAVQRGIFRGRYDEDIRVRQFGWQWPGHMKGLCTAAALTVTASMTTAETGMPSTAGGHDSFQQIDAPVPVVLNWIPAGSFKMGDLSGVGQQDEKPVRPVRLPGFWIMRTEVTVAMFTAFVDAADYPLPSGCSYFADGWRADPALSWRSPGFEQADSHPVTCVSWQDAQAFAQWLSRETGLAFSLPSEAQWEYAARAGTTGRYSHGDDPGALCDHANGADRRALRDYPGFDVNDCDDEHSRTAPVGSYTANPWGLYDTTGNVWEWVADCWTEDYTLSPDDGSAYRVEGCSRRAYRGGAYGDIPQFLRVALRNRGYADERRDDVGFRLVLPDGTDKLSPLLD